MATEDETRATLYGHIKATADNLGAYNPLQRAQALESLALAFRYTIGGQQPGASVTPSK